MKRILIITLLFLSLSGCSGKYEGWKEIELQDYGNIKVPEGWTCHIQDNEIYFVDEGVTDFTENNVHLGGYIYEESYILATQKLFDVNAKHIDNVKGEVYSNDTYRGINKYYINDAKKIKLEAKK